MYFEDHNPPHFHAVYGDADVEVGIDPVALLRGRFPRRALAMVMEWAVKHRRELRTNWELVQAEQSPREIAPLD